MYKSDLKAKWGQYIDTDDLVDKMIMLYTKYGVRCSEYGVCEQLDVFFTNKQNLIDLLKTSDNYAGNLRIVFDVELERENSSRDVRRFCEFFMRNVGAEKVIIKKVDDKGKSQADYLKTGIESLKPADLFDKAIREKLTASYADTNQFNGLGEYKPSVALYDSLNHFMMYSMGYNYQTQLKKETIDALSENKLDVKLAEGMKTSRAFNRICTTYGINKCAKYEKLFAEYADMVSGLKRKLKFFISVNPLDYITMSNGVNWTSCHSVRNGGGWCGGTLSYMLDSTSIITFVHSSIPTDIEEGKIYRNMFHFEDDLLLQARIYPQGNDGATDLYKTFRGFVQDEFAKLLGLENNMWVKKGDNRWEHIESRGCHYRDYNDGNKCFMTYPKERSEATNAIIHIGHNRVCPYCGEVIEDGTLSSSRLAHIMCSAPIRIEDMTDHTIE